MATYKRSVVPREQSEQGHFQRNLPDTGLMDYKARAYDPYLGRFTQPDTIIPGAGNPQAYNRYGYVSNNPINKNDPSGHMACWDDNRNDPYCNGKYVNSTGIHQKIDVPQYDRFKHLQ
ncbi:MAG: hypothetical protein CVU42_08940 [Chloroflexi bacterium HGW-Chloroflexi-4]|nr:MAG: hypothetical protein CVU42_08940 [Chloroflexi bacterium HGW-Chloroflexi-4]